MLYDPRKDQEPIVTNECILLKYKMKPVAYVEAHPNYSLMARVFLIKEKIFHCAMEERHSTIEHFY